VSADGYTLREVDERFGRPKGSAFRKKTRKTPRGAIRTALSRVKELQS